jgi:hypothetical protein
MCTHAYAHTHTRARTHTHTHTNTHTRNYTCTCTNSYTGGLCHHPGGATGTHTHDCTRTHTHTHTHMHIFHAQALSATTQEEQQAATDRACLLLLEWVIRRKEEGFPRGAKPWPVIPHTQTTAAAPTRRGRTNPWGRTPRCVWTHTNRCWVRGRASCL